MATAAQFLSCDWGSTHVRLRLVDRESGTVIHEVKDTSGATVIAADCPSEANRENRFRTTFTSLAQGLQSAVDGDITHVPAVFSGMVTSAHGWMHLPYAEAPVALDGSGFVVHRQREAGRPLLLVSGVRTTQDVMRGEETELAGLAALPSSPLLHGESLVILPGTHTKHVMVKDGVLIDFATHLTGELYALLRDHSVLGHSLDNAGDEMIDEAFAEGLEAATREPLTKLLFSVRVGTLLHGHSDDWSASYVNGLLLGTELRDLPQNVTLVLCAHGCLAALYKQALRFLGFDEQVHTVADEDVRHLVALGHRRVLEAGSDL